MSSIFKPYKTTKPWVLVKSALYRPEVGNPVTGVPQVILFQLGTTPDQLS